MTRKTFRRQVLMTIAAVLLISAVLLFASCHSPPRYTEALKAFPAIIVAIGAAWLAYCWQRRVAFTKALFDVWQKLVNSIQDAIQYTHLSKHEQPEFAKVMHSLSCRLDDIRGAFRNVGEKNDDLSEKTKIFVLSIKSAQSLDECAIHVKNYHPSENVGVYPFETLKQISGVINRLGFGDKVTPQQALIARNTIVALWKILRGELLKELDRDFPEYSDTPYQR
jgi:hypothetical protein